MTDTTNFLDDDNWIGGYYELAIDLGKSLDVGSDERLANALQCLWGDEGLDGCYLDRWKQPSDQPRASAQS